MTSKELKNKSYRIATGAYLVGRLDEDEYNQASISDVANLVWEPMEKVPTKDVCRFIEDLASDIESMFRVK